MDTENKMNHCWNKINQTKFLA